MQDEFELRQVQVERRNIQGIDMLHLDNAQF